MTLHSSEHLLINSRSFKTEAIPLASYKNVLVNTRALASGYGRTSSNSSGNVDLYSVEVDILPESKCRIYGSEYVQRVWFALVDLILHSR